MYIPTPLCFFDCFFYHLPDQLLDHLPLLMPPHRQANRQHPNAANHRPSQPSAHDPADSSITLAQALQRKQNPVQNPFPNSHQNLDLNPAPNPQRPTRSLAHQTPVHPLRGTERGRPPAPVMGFHYVHPPGDPTIPRAFLPNYSIHLG